MELIFKVGNKKPSLDLGERARYWRDGQLVDIRPNGFFNCKYARRHFCVIETPHDYWDIRGSRDWKSSAQKVFDLKKYLTPADSGGKLPWEMGFNEEKERGRLRDYFVDFKYLLDQGWITLADFESIYTKDKDHNRLFLDRDYHSYLFHEDVKTRLPSDYADAKGTISSGTYSIGSGLDYNTVTLFEADIAAQLTGNLTGEHANEETAISSNITLDVDTEGYLLKLTAASGAEHNGGAYGNGARINYSGFSGLMFSESSAGTLDNVEISKLAIDASNNNNIAVSLYNGGDSGLMLADRLLIKGDTNTNGGILLHLYASNARASNCILYDINDAGSVSFGIKVFTYTCTHEVYNNTVIGCYDGIRQDDASIRGTKTFKNNLVQNSSNNDWVDDGGGFGTHAYNVSEDATSPDAAYQSKDVHTNSVFKDYANDDYRLDSGGDATNLAILDDGEDLSGTFTDDIEGQTRSTWYIGASEIVAAGGMPMPVVMQQMDQFNGGAM